MKVPYLDLRVRHPAHRDELLRAVENVLTHGRLVLGPEVEELERQLANRCGRRFAVAVSSGSDALYMALRALDIGPGDEVITTPMSWIATLNAIVMVGATPVFADVRADLNLNPEHLTDAITSRTRAILPVHFTGKMCDMGPICRVAEDHGVEVIEDAAQAFGARSADGRRAGSAGRLACLSMNSMKVLHSYGEAGAVLTDDERLKDRLVALRYAGTVNREDCHYPSLNFRIHTVQAAMLLVELKRIEDIISRRRDIARYYRQELAPVVDCPVEAPGSRHVYYTYTIQTDDRDELKQYLASRGIETKIHHPILMPYHTAYRGKFEASIPVAEQALKRMLSIPNHENLTTVEIEYVTSSILGFYGVTGTCGTPFLTRKSSLAATP